MSTHDVPGAKAGNNDQLAMGAWAEHDDGSLIFVESTEGGRVIYVVFDMSDDPITEYRDAMAEAAFKDHFSWDGAGDKWTWHDKTPFPWDRVIKAGARPGARYASADDLMTAAARVARSRDLHGQAVDRDDYAHMTPQERAAHLIGRLQDAIKDMPA